MKKFCAVSLAVTLLCVIASVSWGFLNIEFNAYDDKCYVGATGDIAVMMVLGTGGSGNFSISGTLPPGCSLKHDANSKLATINGTPTKAGTYTFTINATVIVTNIEYRYINGFPHPYTTYKTDTGSRTATITIRDSGSNNNNNNNGNNNNNQGNSNEDDESGDNTSNNNGNNSNGSGVGNVGSSGGGGCNSGFTLLALTMLALFRRKN